MLKLGGMSLDPHSIALPIAGFFAKRAADAATARAAAEAGALIRSGGDAMALQVPPNVLQQIGGVVPRRLPTCRSARSRPHTSASHPSDQSLLVERIDRFEIIFLGYGSLKGLPDAHEHNPIQDRGFVGWQEIEDLAFDCGGSRVHCAS